MLFPSSPRTRMHSIRFAGCVLLGSAGATLNSQTPPPASDGFDPNANGIVNSLAIQPDGKILMAGYFTQIHPYGYPVSAHAYIARLNHSGSVDESFGPNANGVVRVMALQPNGQIIIGGLFTAIQPGGGGAAVTRNYAARLNADGSLDPNADRTVLSLAIQANGQIVVGGGFSTLRPGGSSGLAQARSCIARLNT